MHVLDELHHLEIKKKNRIAIKDFNNSLHFATKTHKEEVTAVSYFMVYKK